MSIPDYVPNSVLNVLIQTEELYEKQKEGFLSERAGIRFKAIEALIYSDDPRMERVWHRLEGLKPCAPSIPELTNSEMFARSVGNAALCGLNPAQKIRPADLDKWERDIQGVTEKLISLIQGTELEEFKDSDRRFAQDHGFGFKGCFSDQLTEFLSSVPNLINRGSGDHERVYIKAPNDPLSLRVFFVLSLSEACKELFGESLTTPVEVVTSALFPDNPIDGSAVRRIVRESRNFREES